MDVEPAVGVEHLLDPNTPATQTAVDVVTALAKAYTRGRGFDDQGEPAPELAAVITTAAARLAANGAQLPVDLSTGDYGRSIRGGFNGWTSAELYALNRYRRRAQ